MSRFTSSPFHKPSPFQFPHALPSPPETQAESIAMMPSVASGIHDQGINESVLGMSSPDQGSRIRRSSIAYNPSNLREPKDRPNQRPGKPLIIVVPPPSLIPNYAQISTALVMGPPNRMLQGTIMPLLPSMFAQLTAIAKEFNFPSTTGLCLYMHYMEDGISMTPRISEESWHSLWTHFSESALLPHERKALVAGKIEFDIDLRHARWYTAWISNVLREVPEPLPHHFPSAAPSSLAHFRGESKTTFTEGRHLDDDIPETNSPRPLLSASVGRHVPRKLSLVERFDVTKPESKVNALAAESSSNAQVLSPIVQEDEPHSARNDLDNRVNSWRATALSSTHKLSAKGQPSLDPPNLPNDIPIQSPSLPVEEEVELNLADYAWSVSSNGPASYGELSPLSWSRVSSVDIAHRMVGSVCSTPSICTSFGPADYETLESPVSWGRVPSVHLGDRLAGSVATTPSVCTSFGPADYDPLSPLEPSSRIASPDIAHRFFEHGPPTPYTATSWGAPSSYPPSPMCLSATSSVGLVDRISVEGHNLRRYSREDEEEEQEGEIKLFNPWPFSNRFPRWINDGSDVHFTPIPHSEERSAAPEHFTSIVWPHSSVRTPSPVQEEDVSSLREISPYVAQKAVLSARPWGHAWPYNGVSQPQSNIAQPKRDLDHTCLYNKTSEAHETTSMQESLSVSSYNMMPSKTDPQPLPVFSASTFGYPYMRIYTPVYPNLEVYPPYPGNNETVQGKDRFTHSAYLPSCYPCLEIYKPGYPHNLENIYPPLKLRNQPTSEHVDYPYFNLYPAKSGPRYGYLCSVMRTPCTSYPHMEIYPAVQGKPMKSSTSFSTSLSPRPLCHYPVLNLYPAVYPYFDLYPSPSLDKQDASCVEKTRPTVEKINLHIYPPTRPAVYPDFDIYPAMLAPFWHTGAQPPKHVYPHFDLYPAVYPHFNLYPLVGAEMKGSVSKSKRILDITNTRQAVYPYFDLYPAVYPHFSLYPPVNMVGSMCILEVQTKTLSTCPQAIYPTFNLYPAVYPHMDLYLPLPRSYPVPEKQEHKHTITRDICKARATSRLTHSELHAMVMMERVGSAGGFHAPQISFDDGDTSSPISPQRSHSPSGLRFSRITHLPSNPREIRRPSMAFSATNSSLVNDGMALGEQTTTFLKKSFSQKHRESPSSPEVPVQRPMAHRRDSLVSQRIKAYAANVDSGHFQDTVGRFPMPPTPPSRGFPPLPRIPTDR